MNEAQGSSGWGIVAGRCVRFACGVMCLVVLLGSHGARAGKSLDWRLETDVDILSPDTVYRSCIVTIRNDGQERTVTMKAVMNSYHSNERMSMVQQVLTIPNGETRVEMPVYAASKMSSGRISFLVDGSEVKELALSIGGGGWDNSFLFVHVGDGEDALKKAIETYNTTYSSRSSDRFKMEQQVRAEMMPSMWQGYLGGNGALVLNVKEVDAFSAAQKEALRRWVCYGGGMLCLYSDTADIQRAQAAADALRLLLPKIKRAHMESCGTGSVIAVTSADLSSLLMQLSNHASQTARLFGIAGSEGRGGYDSDGLYPPAESFLANIFNGLHQVPRGGFIVLSIVLALIIGPINLLVLRRRKKLAWFYLTAPLLSFSGVLLIGGYLVFRDGWTVKANEMAVLLHEQETGRGAIYQARGVFAPVSPSEGLQYATDVAVIPFQKQVYRRYKSTIERSVDWTNAQHLTGGWVRSRSLDGVLSVSPISVRLGIEVTPNPDGTYTATNGLTGTVTHLYVKTAKGVLRAPHSVEPGEKVVLIKVNMSSGNDWVDTTSMSREMGGHISSYAVWEGIGLFSMMKDLPQAAVFARVEHVPHLDDGGMACEMISTKYAYVGLLTRGYVGPEGTGGVDAKLMSTITPLPAPPIPPLPAAPVSASPERAVFSIVN